MDMEYYPSLSLSKQACNFYGYLLLFMVASFTTYLIIIIKSSRKHRPAKLELPPGPKPWPLVGSIPEMLGNKPAVTWIHKVMSDANTDIACLRLGNVHVVPVTCPTIAREILKKQDANFASRPLVLSAELVSNGYLTPIFAPFGEQWKKMKKIMSNELLSPLRLQWLHDKRMEEADHLVRYVYNQSNNEQKEGLVNVRTCARHYCGNVIRRMIFNKRYFGEGGKDGGPGFKEEEHMEAIFTLLRYLYAFSVSDYMPCLRGLDLDGHQKMVKKAMGIIKKYHDPIIKERIEQWKDGGKRDLEDWLDVLITLKDANNNQLLTSEEIKASIIEFMIATVDNPSSAVEWTIAEMMNQLELFKRATEELDRVVGKERLVQESDICKLNYVKACARESFRLHPFAPFLPPHVCMTNTTVANYFIPKGSHVILSRRGLGRNKKAWDDPNKFKPERHLNKSDGSHIVVLAEPDLRFISFSTGRRGCPGIMLGTSMTIMLLARLLHCFTWRVQPNVSNINLVESEQDGLLSTPLVATAETRLPTKVLLGTN